MTMLYPNLCYNDVSYKRTTLYLLDMIIHQCTRYTNHLDSVVQCHPKLKTSFKRMITCLSEALVLS